MILHLQSDVRPEEPAERITFYITSGVAVFLVTVLFVKMALMLLHFAIFVIPFGVPIFAYWPFRVSRDKLAKVTINAKGSPLYPDLDRYILSTRAMCLRVTI